MNPVNVSFIKSIANSFWYSVLEFCLHYSITSLVFLSISTLVFLVCLYKLGSIKTKFKNAIQRLNNVEKDWEAKIQSTRTINSELESFNAILSGETISLKKIIAEQDNRISKLLEAPQTTSSNKSDKNTEKILLILQNFEEALQVDDSDKQLEDISKKLDKLDVNNITLLLEQITFRLGGIDKVEELKKDERDKFNRVLIEKLNELITHINGKPTEKAKKIFQLRE